MNRLPLFNALLVSVFLPILAGAQGDERPYDRSLEPAKSFHAARDLIEAGKFEEAHGIHMEMFSDVAAHRPNVFFLTVYNLTYDWHQAAQQYQPAMDALLEYQGELERQLTELKKGEEEPSIEDKITLRTVFSFNEWLEEDARSSDLFTLLEKQYSGLTNRMYFHCKDALVRAERYPTIIRYEPDPKRIVDLAAHVYATTIDARSDLEQMARNRFEKSIIDSLNAFSALGHDSKVEELRKLSLEVLDSEEIETHTPTDKTTE